MRWVHLTVIVLFAALVVIFGLQNLRSVLVSFLGFDLNTSVAVLVAVVYVLGAATGSSLFALLRRSYAGSRGIGSISTTASRHP